MKRVFLVEDDGDIAKNLAALLREEGFAVTHAATQREAGLMLADGTFDLALVDVSLVIVFITMLYATRRIKRENIIDALRDDMT